MKKPDRFDRMMERVQSVVDVSSDGRDTCAVHSRDVVTLLRRQHAAYVRLVKAERDRMKPGAFSVTNHRVDGDRLGGHKRACDDILAALVAYKKGQP